MSRQDGAVINLGIVHPDHMTCISHSLQAYLVQSLAEQTVPQAAEFCAESVHRTLVRTNWSSPTRQSPSGTIYVPGRAEVYYPQGTDWFKGRIMIYYLIDSTHTYFAGEKTCPSWMRLWAEKILENQRGPYRANQYRPRVHVNPITPPAIVARQAVDPLEQPNPSNQSLPCLHSDRSIENDDIICHPR